MPDNDTFLILSSRRRFQTFPDRIRTDSESAINIDSVSCDERDDHNQDGNCLDKEGERNGRKRAYLSG